MVILFFLLIIISIVSGLKAIAWNLFQSENQEKKENERNLHILSAIVLVAGVVLIAAPIILIIWTISN